MKRSLFRLIVTTSICIVIAAVSAVTFVCRRGPTAHSSNAGDPISPPPLISWSLLLYDDADFPDAYDPLDDFAAKVYSSSHVNALVLQDTEKDGSAQIWHIGNNHEKNPIYSFSSEINMGNPATLEAFLAIADSLYPSDRMIVAFYDHGMAWTGACIDKTSDYDHLTMDEIQKGLEARGGVDMICFTAPCNMGHFEGAYELRALTRVYMGSEATSGYVLWENPMEQICQTLQTEPDIDIHELGRRIVRWIESNAVTFSDLGREIYTMSAVRTDQMEDVRAALDALCTEFLKDIPGFAARFDSVSNSIMAHTRYRMMDMVHMAKRFLELDWPDAIHTRLETLEQTVLEAILAESHGWGQDNNFGLTIYFPPPYQINPSLLEYCDPGYGLDLSSESLWDDLIQAYQHHVLLSTDAFYRNASPVSDGYHFPVK